MRNRSKNQICFTALVALLFVHSSVIATQELVVTDLPRTETRQVVQPDVGMKNQKTVANESMFRADLASLFIDAQENEADQNQKENPSPKFSAELIEQGKNAFQNSCVDCHDAERSLSKQKGLSDWRNTVRRMAAKNGASVPAGDIEPIAVYLTSLNPNSSTNRSESGNDQPSIASSFSVFGTVSPLFRNGDHDSAIENSGFFGDAWVGAEWRPGGAVSGRVSACTSCHNSRQGLEIELAEALLEIDINKVFFGESNQTPIMHTKITAGRMIVPFGAFSKTVHPGANRAVSNPLMFNMGRRVFGNVGPPRQPVLPMPYADEGMNIHSRFQLPNDWQIKLDIYGVNGLQQGGSAPGFGATSIFLTSRSYTDNNSKVAFGGRASAGNRFIDFGGSAMSGELQPDGAARRYYSIIGFDASIKMKDLVKVTFEYAARREEIPGFVDEDFVYGMVISGEILILPDPKLYLFSRYDTLEYRDNLGADDGVYRLTWGINLPTTGGSLLSINHEHWQFPVPQPTIDVIGARWTTAF